ncbi:DUF6473 family protein [Pseudorhodobacter sp.]|uniref:DUF6473 family protein n=1 Tax=Pseudorhodobacter sp. TaxID=1934400 RepID=UPI00264A3DAE|nr:DUF6473 family protein [Pseudorhodobacter sp.]MDN5785945.1 DUF6473 family protein [Pseudorhodobacter sp.]
MAFVYQGDFSLDYQPCHYGASKLVFRGPKQAMRVPYCAAIGGTETYGKFVREPFPMLVAQRIGRPVVNLGCVNAGLDVFLNDPDVLELASGAELTVVQVVGASNLNNRFFSVHPRRNDRFLSASSWLQTLYRDVDFTDFHFTRHLLQTLYQVSPSRFETVATELRETWVRRMTDLLRAIKGPTLLLWMAENPPPGEDSMLDPYANPVLVEAGMIAQVRRSAMAYLEVVTSRDAKCEGIENMAVPAMELRAAEEVPGPMAHRETALAISGAISELIGPP